MDANGVGVECQGLRMGIQIERVVRCMVVVDVEGAGVSVGR